MKGKICGRIDMIRKVTLYHVICDGCGTTYPHNGVNEEMFFERKTALTTCIYAGWAKVDGKLYCPDCYEYGKETDSYKPKKKGNKI